VSASRTLEGVGTTPVVCGGLLKVIGNGGADALGGGLL
jgi:hypothetical protein